MTDLLTADRLVVNQRPKLVELTNQYVIRDAQGQEIGFMQQEGQSKLRKVLRFATDVDQFLTHRLALYDTDGNKLLQLVRPAKIFKSKFSVEDGNGNSIGSIVQRNVFGKIGFELLNPGGGELGRIQAENWRAWDFAIVDNDGKEIGRIDKKFVGVLKAVFTPADNYIVDIDPTLEGEIRLLTIAAAIAVDTALKQDARGFSLTDVIE
ncbi:MAG TPA: phospholipid scramblase-related protein [Actinomycetota bacterium]|nr:phospholipid scramblase-related protein [Actinomycetota bacterium]